MTTITPQDYFRQSHEFFTSNDNVIIPCNHSDDFAQKMCNYLNKTATHTTLEIPKDRKLFGNGETFVRLMHRVRGKHVIIVCIFDGHDVNNKFMEAKTIIAACQSADARKITLILPYYPYTRSDKKDTSHVAIVAAMVARELKQFQLLSNIISIDLHSSQTQGYFDGSTTFQNMYAIGYFGEQIMNYVTQHDLLGKVLLVAPDQGCAKRIEAYSTRLGINNIILSKKRDYETGAVEKLVILNMEQSYVGKIGLLIDDMADSCGTVVKAVDALIACGLLGIIVLVTHGILSNDAVKKINSCDGIIAVYVTDSIDQSEHVKQCPKLVVVSVATLFAEAVIRCEAKLSLSELFE